MSVGNINLCARRRMFSIRVAGVLFVAVLGAVACNDQARDCADLGGTYNASASPKCALPSKPLDCVQVSNTTNSTNCTDAGNFPSTCAVAACPAGTKLTGGGGICAAGDRRLKGLNPKLSTGEFFIMCEKQGVPAQVSALCCKL
jgi:hypothetical protein